MSRIFISYRRDDTAADMTDRVYERLVRRWGRRVFMDIDSLVGGDVFAKAIDENLQNCAVTLVMIGRHWLSMTDAQGARRIDNPSDYPRMEVAAALRRGVRVIPVLVGDVALPNAADLPQEIAGLSDRQVVRISRERFDADVQRLIDAVAREMPVKSWRDWSWRVIAATVLVTGIVAGAYSIFVGTDAPMFHADPPSVVLSPLAKDAPPVAGRKDSEAPPGAGVSAPAGSEKKSPRVEVKEEKSIAAKKAPTAPSTADKSISVLNVTGTWGTPLIEAAYTGNNRTVLTFEFIQQEDTLLGTITETEEGQTRGYQSAIADGKIKGGVLSFHTKGEVTGGPNGHFIALQGNVCRNCREG